MQEESYNVYEIIFPETDTNNYKTSMFNGRFYGKIIDKKISDAEKYDYNENIRPSVGSTLLFQPLDDWNEKEQRPDYPRHWRYQGDL